MAKVRRDRFEVHNVKVSADLFAKPTLNENYFITSFGALDG